MYLVTGCAGFIGFHMCEELLKKNLRVVGVDSLNNYYSKNYKNKRISKLKKNKNFKFYKINLCNTSVVSSLFKKYNFKTAIHLAAQPGIIYSFKEPDSYTTNNVKATKVLIKNIKNHKTKNFIFTSSSSVYGDHKKYPIKENFNFKPINHYAKTKIIGENIVKKKFLKDKNTSVKIIRPFTVYGPFGRPDMLVLKLLFKVSQNKSIDIFGYGKHLRDFTYVDDVVKIIHKLSLVKNSKIEIFNICASNPIQINKLLDLFEYFLKKKILVNRMPKRKGEMKITYGSNKKLLRFIKLKKFTKIEIGLKKTINWYKQFPKKNFFRLHK